MPGGWDIEASSPSTTLDQPFSGLQALAVEVTVVPVALQAVIVE